MKNPGLAFFTRVIILTAIYFIGGLLGKEGTFVLHKESLIAAGGVATGGGVALVWPPSGIALAAILLFGYRFWPGVALGAILFSFMKGVPSVFYTMGTAIGNTIGAIVCAYLLERFISQRFSLDRVRDTVGFIVFACLIGTTVNAAFNVVGQFYAGEINWEHLFPKLMEWWVPNAMAGLVVTPFILAWGKPHPFAWDYKTIIEAVICLACLTLGTVFSFNSMYIVGASNYPFAYVPYPFLIWGSLRFGQRGATTGTLLVSSLAIWGLVNHSGPFVMDKQADSLMLIGSYIGILSVSNLLLASAAVEREDAEREVAESEKRYRAVVEDQTELISRFKPDGTLTFVNDAYCRFHGRRAEDLLGQKSPLFDTDNQEVHQSHVRALTWEKPVASYDYQLRRPEGQVVWHTCTVRQLFDPWGHPAEIQTVEQDITQRKLAAEALRKSEEMYELITKNVDDLIAMTDAEGKRLYNNPAYQKIFDNPEQLLGTDSYEQIHPEDRQKVKQVLRETIQTGKGQRLEYRFLLKDGSVRYIESLGNYVPGGPGEPGRVVSVSRDITARKQIEEDLAKARDAAVVTARHKAEFLANMSHEIRTPLNGVIGLTNLMLHTPLNKQQHEYAESIRTCSDSLLTIINDILDFSKIEAGKMTLEILDFSLLDAVESSLDLLAERAQAKGIELVGFVQPGVATQLRGDQGRLRQIFVNLLGNAVKFTHEGEVVLTVACEKETEQYSLLRFEVKDTGIGIPLDAQGSLFRSFSQADGSTTRKYGGTGLGLAISRQLVTLMQGQIGLESAPGKGTTFWFTIPFERQTAPTARPVGPADLRVLLVDDNATSRQLLAQQFLAWKMHADSAESGAAALQKLRRAAQGGQPYQLAVLDLQMPEMDGLKLAREIKADPAIASTRLILLSSLVHPPDPETLRAAGIGGSVAKPVKQSKLFDCLMTVMGAPTEEVTRPARPSVAGLDLPPELAPRAQDVRLLLAEDNSINQMVALGQLKELGLTADPVANGAEVLEVLERIPYDIIFMDCQMPEMDGYEATRRIRQQERERAETAGTKNHIVIIAMTAHAMQGDREKCLAAGMDDYLVKPIEEDALKKALEHWMPVVLKQARPSVVSVAAVAPAATRAAAPAPAPAAPAPAPPAAEAAPVDLKRLSRITGGDPAKLRMLTGLYLQQSKELLGGLEKAISEQKSKDVEFIAHKCCGASANCGAHSIVAPLRELERMGREGQLEHAAETYAQAKFQFERITNYLEEYLRSAAGAVKPG